jgi:hypothetical protein
VRYVQACGDGGSGVVAWLEVAECVVAEVG